MPSSSTCSYCGATLRSNQQSCPGCGAPNPGYVPPKDTPGSGKPKTIAELQAFCAERGMPLQKMRFFIGEDHRGPRAFGIYRDGDEFVVYKNKTDGSRAERYRGPDEAYAVNELFQKLKEEHLKRQNLAAARPAPRQGSATRGSGSSGRQKPPAKNRLLFLILAILLGAFLIYGFVGNKLDHKNDGYYRYAGDLFYRYGSSWYAGDAYGDWVEVYDFPAEEYDGYYEGGSYEPAWGGSDFTDSDVWDDLHNSSSSYDDDDWGWDYDDDDYDSWDSGDTDWDSDW